MLFFNIGNYFFYFPGRKYYCHFQFLANIITVSFMMVNSD